MTVVPDGPVIDPRDAALLRGVGDLARNAVPDPERCERHRRAEELACRILRDDLRLARRSPLGPGWSSDIDLHIERCPDPRRLLDAGWVPLDHLFARVGSPGRGRWAIMDGDEVLVRADLQLAAPPDPAAVVLQRCRRRGEIRAREVLELRSLVRDGTPLPAGDPLLARAARAEAALGGATLARWAGPLEQGSDAALPIPVGGLGRRVRRELGRLRRRPRRVVVALSGVDGAGKSTVATRLVDDLRRVGIPAGRVWARPGMNLGVLDGVARLGKRLLGRDAEPGVRAVARGAGEGLAGRRGATGWLWSLAVTVAFVVDVRRQHRRVAGVAVYDRHAVDAQVTLEFVYAGTDLRVQRWLVRRMLPTAAWTFYLDVPATVAVARKPHDSFGEHAVRRQLDRYASRRAGLRHLDATRPAPSLTADVLRVLSGV